MEKDPRISHAQIIKTSNTLDQQHSLPLLNKLITFYSKSHQFPKALSVFHQIPSPNVVSWTALISGNPNSPLSLHHFISMLRHPTRPNQRTLASVFKTCASLCLLSFGQQLHAMSLKLCLCFQPFCGCALVDLYMKCRVLDHARKVFDEMPVKDEVCYSSMVVGFARNCRPVDALGVFAEMVGSGVSSTVYSVSGALTAGAELAALEQCRVIHGHGVVTGINRAVYVSTGLVTAYGKCGMVSEARRVFDESLFDMNIVGWNAMMAAYAHQGNKLSVIELFRLAELRGLVLDDYSFLAVLTSLYNAGLADEAEKWISKMKVDYKLEPSLEHYTCLVGALGRVGRLDDAERVAMTMPFKPDAGIWRVLLSASAANGAPETAWRMSKRLLDIDPYDDSAYVIAANTFSAVGRRYEASEIRKKMNNLRVKKESGKSWIEVRGEVHVFVAGDGKHNRIDEVYSKLAELMKEIGKLGYVPNWSEMIHDVEEGEKREGLSYHSEKLALAFGVVSGAAPPGKPLRILKNLRICRDCHEAFKYFSLILEKEIIVRDVNRYHTFLDGKCTCGDYW
ncbi:putative pentatricopeptide repeat-containing protein At5g52630 [Silene latifolia]|uniref:putative pentatricopeptide repeat-containing protein At5g52630 n=1 Tax=Silene latifolia TaxID=37657 RepID=UPI003D7860B9